LVGIFILAIGLVCIATVIPLSAWQLRKAHDDTESVRVANNALAIYNAGGAYEPENESTHRTLVTLTQGGRTLIFVYKPGPEGVPPRLEVVDGGVMVFSDGRVEGGPADLHRRNNWLWCSGDFGGYIMRLQKSNATELISQCADVRRIFEIDEDVYGPVRELISQRVSYLSGVETTYLMDGGMVR